MFKRTFKRICAVSVTMILILSIVSLSVSAAIFTPSQAVAQGIDVSAYQGQIDWNAVKASGKVDFAIIRCGYGQDMTSQDDTYFRRNVQECQRVGIPFGLYLYSYTTTVSGASGEADHCIRLINECKNYSMFQLPMYYDLEESSAYALSKSTLLSIAQTFHDKIESATGKTVGIYANTNWFTNKLTDSWYQEQPLWCAQYYSSCQYSGDYDLWQYSSSGSVSGISGRVDMNYSRVPVSQISGGTNTPAPSVPSGFHSDQLLQKGSGGEQVRYLQYALKTFGYYTMSVDGDYGNGTVSAVTAYQSANGLDADGMAGSSTLGDIIFEAKWLQRNLRGLGYYTGEIDAILDDDVNNAISRFQSDNGLSADGIANTTTLNAIVDKCKYYQSALTALGYYGGGVDGQFGEGSISAVKAFQTAEKLEASGYITAQTGALISKRLQGLNSAGTTQKPDSNVNYKWMWANDENNTILTKYNYTSGDNLGGGHYGYDTQNVSEMRKYGFVDRCKTLNVTYMIEAPEKGKYSVYLTYVVGNLTAGEPYTMVVGVNDKTFYESTRGLVGDGNNRMWIDCDLFTLDLEKGVNIVRILPAAADNYSTDIYVDFNALLIDNRCTCVTSQYKPVTSVLSPAASSHINKYEIIGETLTNADTSQTLYDHINYYSLNNENLSKVPYYSYTFDAPYDGYYNMYQSHTSASENDNGIGRITYAVDGRFYDASIKLHKGVSEVYLTPYMTKGRHTITITNITEYEGTYGGAQYHGAVDIKDIKVGNLTVYGAVKADTQINPQSYAPIDGIFYADDSATFTNGKIAVNEQTHGDSSHRQIGAFNPKTIPFDSVLNGQYNINDYSTVTYNLYADKEGQYDITSVFQLAPASVNCQNAGYFMTVAVNGTQVQKGTDFKFYYRDTPDNKKDSGVSTVKVNLNKGKNVVTFFMHTSEAWAKMGNGWVDFDFIRVSGDCAVSKYSNIGVEAPEIEIIGENFIVVKPKSGYEYSIDGENWQTSTRFEGLSPNKRYSFYQRKAGESGTKSEAKDCAIVTAPEITLVGATKLYIKPTVGYEYSIDGVNWQTDSMFTSLNPNREYTVYQRISGDNVHTVVSVGTSANTNGNDNINTAPTADDLVSLRKEIMDKGRNMSCDYNGDGQISLLDLMRLKLFMAGEDVPLGAPVSNGNPRMIREVAYLDE